MIQALIDTAAELIERGLPIVPVDGKKPLGGKAWHQRTYTAEEIATALGGASEPCIGLVLGEKYGVIDIEADNAEQEAAFAELFAGCDVPVTPTFESRRGKHRLFAWHELLADTGAAVVDFCKLGIRIGAGGKGAQSVIPPSPGRKWLVSPDEVEYAVLPQTVVERIIAAANGGTVNGKAKRGKAKRDWSKVTGGVSEGERNETCAIYAGRQLELIGDVTDERKVKAAFENVLVWNRTNTPQLPEGEVREVFDSILRTEKNKKALGRYVGWKLVEWSSDPPTYGLIGDEFTNARDRCVVLIDDEVERGRAVRSKIRSKAGIAYGLEFARAWDQTLYVALMDAREFRDVPPEQKRRAVVAGRVLAVLEQAVDEKNYAKIDLDAYPLRKGNGNVVFRFNFMMDQIAKNAAADAVTRLEVSRLHEEVGVKTYRPEGNGHRRRAREITKAAIDQLVTIESGKA